MIDIETFKFKPVKQSIVKYHTIILNVFLVLGIIVIALTTLFTTLDIIARTLNLGSIAWTIELSQIFMLWVTFFVVAWLYFRDDHITFDVVYDLLPIKMKYIVNITARIISTITVGIFTYLSYLWLADIIKRNVVYRNILAIPGWVVYGPVFVCLLILFITCLIKLFLNEKIEEDN